MPDNVRHIDFNSQGSGFNAEVSKVKNIIDLLKDKYPGAYDFNLYVKANFYKAGKGYYNKIRGTTLSFETKDALNATTYHSLESGDLDQRNYKLTESYHNQ